MHGPPALRIRPRGYSHTQPRFVQRTAVSFEIGAGRILQDPLTAAGDCETSRSLAVLSGGPRLGTPWPIQP
jgi:hypothetical protein